MAAAGTIRPISEWTEEQLWAAFLLVDGLHDYGDIGGTRSVRGAYDWYIAQEIPKVLLGTYYAPPAASIAVKTYAEAVFGLTVLSPSTKVEPLLTNLLQRGLSRRMGLETAPNAPDMSLADFGLVPSGIYYRLPLERLVTIAATGGPVLERLIDVCKSLRRIRLDREGFKESGGAITAAAQAGLSRFFQELVSAANPTLFSNFDASPGFYKYLYGFTQAFTPLNFLDSVGASDGLFAPGSAAAYVPVAEPLSYNTQFMSLKRSGEDGVGPLFSISISTEGAAPYPLTITVSYNGVAIATDTIAGTLGAGKSFVSGPTLGYIANLIAAIQAQPAIDAGLLGTLIANAHDGKNIYKLERLIQQVGVNVEYNKELLCRFLSDWKGYGDAEQVRFMAEHLARDPAAAAAPLAVTEARSLLTRSLIGGTVDENSHQQMTLRNITHGYSHFKFYDFVVFPTVEPTAGDLLYTRITDLLSRATGILNLAHKLSSLSALSGELLAGLSEGYTSVTEASVLPQLSVSAAPPSLLAPLTTLLKYKFCNAHQFVSECRATDAAAIAEAIGKFQIPTTAFEALKGKDQAALGEMTVTLSGNPEPVSITTFADNLERAMNEQQPDAGVCASVLANLASPQLMVGDNVVPLPYIQTVVFGTSTDGRGQILKQNTTIGFEPKHLTAIATNLVAILNKTTYPDVVTSSTQKITAALYAFLSSFYVPDGAAFNKAEIDTLVYNFKAPIVDTCEKVQAAVKSADRGSRQATNERGKAEIAAVMAANMTALQEELMARLQLGACQARMEPEEGQLGGANLFTSRIDALYRIASGLPVFITDFNWEWVDRTAIDFEHVITDANVLDNDGGLATNEGEFNEEEGIVDWMVVARRARAAAEARKRLTVTTRRAAAASAPVQKAVKKSTSEVLGRKRREENIVIQQKLRREAAAEKTRPAAFDSESFGVSTPPVVLDPYTAAGAPAGYKTDTDIDFSGGLRTHRPLYSNARTTDVPLQLERNEGLRERRRTRRNPRIRQ